MHSNEITPLPKKKRIYRWVGIFLLVVFSPTIIEFLYLSYLRNKNLECSERVSPDGAYTKKSCTLKSRRERSLSFFYNTWIEEIQIIDNSTGKVVHKATLFDADYDSIPTRWSACETVMEDKRPKDWKPGDICHVRWARAMGAGNFWDENDYSTYLPPSKWQQFKAKLP